MDVLADGRWEKTFKVKPPVFTREEKRAWLDTMTGVSLGSDAFFHLGIILTGPIKAVSGMWPSQEAPVRDDQVIETCNQYGMVMAFTGIRLFHH